jgi:hypothetical protein
VGLLLSIWSTRYQIGSVIQPGPGFLPLGLGLFVVLLSLILVAQGARSSHIVQTLSTTSLFPGWKKVAYTVSILILAIFFFERIGYLLTFFLVIMFLMRAAGPESWKKIFTVAFCSALGIYLVFVLLLEQPLPRGLLGM